MTSSKRFEYLEEDLLSILEFLEVQINVKLTSSKQEAEKAAVREIEKGFEDANELIKEIQSETRTFPFPYRHELNGRIDQYKSDISKLKSKFAHIHSNSKGSADGDMLNSTRQTAINASDTLSRASAGIQRSHHLASENEVIGTNIISELSSQRETLMRSRNRLEETNAEIGKSRRVINTLRRRVLENKLLLIVIIIMETAILISLITYKYII